MSESSLDEDEAETVEMPTRIHAVARRVDLCQHERQCGLKKAPAKPT
jgi:hypothetical protein